jgi:hypothetical protein
MFAASLGLSVLLPAQAANESLTVTVRFATYEAQPTAADTEASKPVTWRRLPQGPFSIELSLQPESLQRGVELPDWPGVRIKGVLRDAKVPSLEAGTRVLSVFLVNQRNEAARGRGDQDFLFQVELELFYARGFVERPNRWGETASDFDDRVSDLQYRDHCEWAVGHGVATSAGPLDPTLKRVQRVRTTFIPVSEVYGVRGINERECEVVSNMLELAELASREDGAALQQALLPLTKRYSEWIDAQQAMPIDRPKRRETQAELVQQARLACERIQRGIERLATDAEARRAFGWTNHVMAHAALQRSPQDYPNGKTPAWRTFQLAFVLLNLVDIADPHSAHREQVELIFFPTGGGKTEAYLGVIAFTLLLRRLHGQTRPDAGLGVAVLLRYTLRLLTLDQLGRAATLMCQLELLRQRESVLGSERFAVGLWVGRSATANTLDEVHKAILDYRSSTSENASSPFPLANCPHCREPLGRDAITVQPSIQKPERVVVCCSNYRCEFSARKNRDGLPVLFVDEQIYRELPAFLVATVDKFAMLPWRGETGMLFGRAHAHLRGSFFGPMDGGSPKGATPLPDGLMPPELIVQDELHLIAGPLGTMVGLYETAIEFLCTRKGPETANAADDRHAGSIKPKIIASTATVRRAQDQVEDLFGRAHMRLFPPQGVDAWNTFFAKPDLEKPGRLYVGVAAQGRSMRGSLIRCYASLLTAANKHYDKKGPADQTADAFMTLVGYFNSLRELGGMRRLVEDDVHTRALSVEERRPLNFKGPHPWSRKRLLSRDPVELTSRESTHNIKLAKDRLQLPYAENKHVDVLLASNMISVGVDIDRLGLMVVAGQPKTTSEYIQASSRVGRKTPGVVITCYNTARPRDRSHYERFCTYHETFYRFVEAMSLTPLSGPALQRGLAGTLVAMMRLGYPALTPGNAVMDIAEHRKLAERVAKAIAARGSNEALQQQLMQRANKLFDSWEKVVKATLADAGQRKYSRFDRDGSKGKELLFLATDQHKPDASSPYEARFQAPTSMRDVEASVPLWVTKSFGGKR